MSEKNSNGILRTTAVIAESFRNMQTAAERTRSNGTFGTGATESTTVPKVHPYQYHFFS